MAVSTLAGWCDGWGGGACARVRARAVPAAGPCLDARRTTPPVYRYRVRPPGVSQVTVDRGRRLLGVSLTGECMTSRISHKFTPRHPLLLRKRGFSNIRTSTQTVNMLHAVYKYTLHTKHCTELRFPQQYIVGKPNNPIEPLNYSFVI